MDTRATDHITSDLDRIAIRDAYNGNERVHIGNGAGLHISHVGHGTLNTTTKTLSLFPIYSMFPISQKIFFPLTNSQKTMMFLLKFIYIILLSRIRSQREGCSKADVSQDFTPSDHQK
jgi:hypothetical protein